jgi:hypothetical protein
MYDLGLPSGPAGAAYNSAVSCSLNPQGGLAAGSANLEVSEIPVASAATVWTYSITGAVMTSVGTDIRPYLPGYSSVQPDSLFNTSFALSINDVGQAVGETALAYGAPESDANDTFIYNIFTQTATSLSALGLRFPYINPQLGLGLSQLINNRGQVVGEEQVGGVWHAAIWDSSNGLRDLNTVYAGLLATAAPGFVLNAATAINDNYIVGYGTDSASNSSQIFLISTTTLRGDANLDGKVDINDLTIVLTNYGKSGMAWSQGDFTDDGKVDINDLTIVLANYNQSLSGSSSGNLAAVPEPTSLLLSGLALLGLLPFVRRRGRP